MSKLEQLLEQEHKSEGFLVLYSTSIPPPTEPPSGPMSFDGMLAYANDTFKQVGISSQPVEPQAPSNPVSLENFTSQKISESLHKQPDYSDEKEAWFNNIKQQLNIPSPVIEQTRITSNPLDPKTYDIEYLAHAVNNLTCPSTPNIFSPSSQVKIDSPVYNPPDFKIPEYNTSKLDNHKVSPLGYPTSEKKFYETFKKSHTVRTYGLDNEKPVHALFKKNEFANVYNQVTKGLKLGKEAVNTIVFTNPLKNEEDFSPSFTPWKKELRFPAIKPKKIPFDIVSQKDYDEMLNNAFLPHELGHAKIEEKYHKKCSDIYSDELKGFNEHLADAFSFDSVKDTPQLFNTRTERIKFENEWVTPRNDTQSRAMENYDNAITSPKDASFIPGKQATVNMLGESLLEQKYDLTLKKALDLKYGYDPHKINVYESINKLSNLYKTEATKLIELSKKDTIISNFKAKRILSSIEKETFRFKEDL